jgi:aldehyde:ferredoxin oxidoreductase
MLGYQDKILDVELTLGKITERPLDGEAVKLYVGCVGLGGKILYDELPTWVSPLDPDNLLIFATGPVTGTPGLSAGRHSVITKSPLTGYFGDASSGGFWGAELKKAGYDIVIVRGRATKPSLLWIKDGVAEIRDASSYWGMTTREADRAIRKDLGDSNIWVADIGPSGENLVRFAGIVNDDGDRIAARCGVGAVMGSKRLKAIAVRGTKSVPVHDTQLLLDSLKELTKSLNANEQNHYFMKWGTSGAFATLMTIGDTPTRNWTETEFKLAENLSVPDGGYAKIRNQQRTCFSCTIHCRPVVTISDGPYKTEGKVEGPEYESLGALGSMLMIGNIEQVVKLNDLCNLYGLDTISTGGVLAWAMESYERGVVSKQDLGGLELNFGDGDAAIKALDMITYRNGFGDVLAEGTRRASRIVRHGSEKWAIEVKGLEMPMHDPRAFQAMNLTYAYSAEGADHMEGTTMRMELQKPGTNAGNPEFPVKATDRLGTEGKGQIAYTAQNTLNAVTALGYCELASGSLIVTYPISTNILFYKAATGLDMSPEEFLRVGERIYNLKRAFNFRHGMQKNEDRIPERLLNLPLPSGPSKGSVAHFDALVKEYLQIRGWDPVTGKPTKERLESLGMADVARDMWPN